jgi:hypothetical protein
MKKILLVSLAFCLACCVIILSCSKTTTPARLNYTITSPAGATITNVYIPDSGTYDLAVLVKFLTGSPSENLTLTFSGLPADVRVTPDTFSSVPTYTEHFVFYTNKANRATYQVQLIAYSPTTGYKSYNITLGVVPAICGLGFKGTLAASSACGTAGYYKYTSTVDTFGRTGLYVSNFAGYGVTIPIVLDCGTDSAFIPQGNYGNGVIMSGKGIFTANKIIMHYTASSTPNGFPDTCVDTLSN